MELPDPEPVNDAERLAYEKEGPQPTNEAGAARCPLCDAELYATQRGWRCGCKPRPPRDNDVSDKRTGQRRSTTRRTGGRRPHDGEAAPPRRP